MHYSISIPSHWRTTSTSPLRSCVRAAVCKPLETIFNCNLRKATPSSLHGFLVAKLAMTTKGGFPRGEAGGNNRLRKLRLHSWEPKHCWDASRGCDEMLPGIFIERRSRYADASYTNFVRSVRATTTPQIYPAPYTLTANRRGEICRWALRMDIDCLNFGTTTRNVQLKLKNFPTQLCNRKLWIKNKNKKGGEKQRRLSRPWPCCTDFFFMSGQCKLCALIGGQRNFSHTRKTRPESRDPKPFLPCATLAPRIPQVMFAMSPDFEGQAEVCCWRLPLEITSINFRLIFIFISYSERTDTYFFAAKICVILSDFCVDLWARHHFELIKNKNRPQNGSRAKTNRKLTKLW